MALVMGYCGLKFGEVTALRVRDVKDGTITVRASVTRVAGKGYLEDTTHTLGAGIAIPVGTPKGVA
jgi:hypothetical protein